MATKEVKKDRTLVRLDVSELPLHNEANSYGQCFQTVADIRQKKHRVEITPLMKATNYTGPTYSFTTDEAGDESTVTEPPKGGEPTPIPKSVGKWDHKTFSSGSNSRTTSPFQFQKQDHQIWSSNFATLSALILTLWCIKAPKKDAR